MKKTVIGRSSVLVCLMLSAAAVKAATDSDASIVHLRTSCMENGATINNCFTDLGNLNSWIWNTRSPTPSAASPLKIEIGPGTFQGVFTCNAEPWNGKNYGSITIQGSGVDNTTLTNTSGPVATRYCENLVFNDMTLMNTGNLFGVQNLGGSTVWRNIRIDGIGYSWFDSRNPCNAGGVHYWFSSSITSTTAAGSTKAYYSGCDESWFFGSEIVSRSSSGKALPIQAIGGEIHVYGSVIRALPEGDTSATAVESTNGSEVHIHGTGIDVIGTGANSITALSAGEGSSIHANESSYVLKTGAGGDITRISNNGGTISAPYQWKQSSTPPAINTETGADTVVITDTPDNHPHLAVSDDSCPGKWFDVNANSCL